MNDLQLFDNDLNEYDNETQVNKNENQLSERLIDEENEIYPSIVFLENPLDFIIYIVVI